MTDTTTTTAEAGLHPTWEEQAIGAYEYEQDARRRRHLECAAGDILALKDKLAELGITPINQDGQAFVVDDDPAATVTALIAEYETDPDDGWKYGRRVWACCRSGRLWLRATHDYPADIIGDVAGELHSLADVGRAISEGPRPLPTPETNQEQAERRLHSGWPDCSMDARAICQAIEGLTYAVLAVADELRDGDLAAIGAGIERYIGGVR